MLSMAPAFKAATGSKGVNGSVYYDDINYQPGGVGSAIHLVAQKNSNCLARSTQDLFPLVQQSEVWLASSYSHWFTISYYFLSAIV